MKKQVTKMTFKGTMDWGEATHYIPAVADLTFRPYESEDDIPLIASVGQRCLDADQKDFLFTEDDVRLMFEHLVNFDPYKDILIASVNDEVIGYIRTNWVQEGDGTYIFRHNGGVLPDWRRRGIGMYLLVQAQNRLRSLAEDLTSHDACYFQTMTAESETGSQAMLEAADYKAARFFFEMERPLTKSLPEALLPAGIEVRPTDPEHFRAIWEAMDEAFRDHWGHVPAKESHYVWWQKSPTFQPDLWKVAWDGDQVAGMVLNYIDDKENARFNRKRGYTEDICVRRPWRRRGLARTLLILSLHILKEHDMLVANLGVDTENVSGALNLYESVGFKTIKRYTTYRKPLCQPL
jgi:ribosomal protein S18 acetylase RimI-like enzyme